MSPAAPSTQFPAVYATAPDDGAMFIPLLRMTQMPAVASAIYFATGKRVAPQRILGIDA